MAEEMSTRGRGICAVCDKEAVYAGQLTEYFSAKGGLPFEVQAFSSTEPLEAYAREHPIDLLLISPDLLSEKLKQLKVKKIMLLSDGSQPKGENLPSTYKYQSSEGILREVLDCYGTVVEPERTSQVRMQRAQFLGVYSPVRRCGRTSFALMLGQVLAADSRVLYLNFEEYSGFRGLFGVPDRDFSELLLHLLQGRPGVFGKLRELVQPLGRMDYIPPGTSHTDLKVMEWEHWERLLESIREEDGYDWVILDLGDCLEGLFSILDQCDRIYVPVKDDPVSAAKLEQFLWVCESLGFQTGEHRLFQVTPPPEDLQRILQEDCEDTALYRYVERLLGDGDRTTSAGGV